nr:large conductance mechanosensitive channel protein MscL [Actinomyces sp.]
MLKGFRDFIAQGNVIDLAVAVIIGAAFSPIVKAVTNVLLNIIGAVVGSPNFDSLGAFSINGSDPIQPGTILTAVVNFLLVAAAIYFCVVVPMNKLKERTRKAQEIEAADEVPAPSETELLVQIRDLLADRK